MRKLTLLLLAAIIATASSAQQAARQSRQLPANPRKAQASQVRLNDTHPTRGRAPLPAKNHAEGQVKAKGGPRLAKAAPTIITDQPAGELRTYSRSGQAMYPYWYWIYYTSQVGSALQVVFADDGKTVYLQDPVSQNTTGAWVQGELSADGKTISVPLGQVVSYWSSYGYGLQTAFLEVGTDDDGNTVSSTDSSVSAATYTIDGDKITLNDSYSRGNTSRGLGLIYTDDFSFSGYLDWESEYTLFNETPQTAPEGLETQQYSLLYGAEDQRSGKLVQVGFDGSDVWIQGLSDYAPEGWVKGALADGKVTIASGQYIGAGAGHFLYAVAATYDRLWDDDYEEYYSYYTRADQIVFDYDAASGQLKAADNQALLVNGSKEEIAYYEAFDAPELNVYADVPATPATPQALGFYDYLENSGYTYATFNVPTTDVDGKFIDSDKLSYIIYTDDDEPFTFYPDEYEALDAPLTEVPYSFTDSYDFFAGASSIYFYETGFRRIGIQSIYRGGGEERRSPIAYYNIVDEQESQASQYFGAYKGDQLTLGNVGTAKAESYDVAIYVEEPSLKGTKVKGLRFPVVERATNASDYRGWLSRELSLKKADGGNVADPDIASVEVTPDGQWAEVTFDKPYTIGSDGFYAGYSFSVSEADGTNGPNSNPVYLTTEYQPGGFWLHTSRTYRSWVDQSAKYQASAAVVLILGGDGVKENAAAFGNVEELYAKQGESSNITVSLSNHGTAQLRNVDYTYTVNGTKNEGHYDLPQPIDGNYFGRQTETTLNLPAIDEKGAYPLELTITKVNGVTNEDAVPSRQTVLNVISFVPKHRALVEEYTGTWCGYCPRGFVGLERMNELYPDDFVAVSYHNEDPMEILPTSQFPNEIPGYPDAWIDRVVETDAYCGDETYGTFGIDKAWLKRSNVLAPADVDVLLTWSDESKTTVEATATVRFVKDISNNEYQLAYVLVADDLHGEGSDWSQSNYYSGVTGWASDMDQFTNGDSYVDGLHFNDVAVAVSSPYGLGEEGSLPATIKEGEAYVHTFQFPLASVLNSAGEAVVQDISKLRVVVTLIDPATGEVVNANKASLQDVVTGIHTVSNRVSDVVSVGYTDLSGRQVAQPRHGIFLKSVRFQDGTVRTVKVVRK